MSGVSKRIFNNVFKVSIVVIRRLSPLTLLTRSKQKGEASGLCPEVLDNKMTELTP